MERPIGVFTTMEEVRAAISKLQALGMTRDDITLITHDDTLQESITDLISQNNNQAFLTDIETEHYGDALREGKILLLVDNQPDRLGEINTILNPEEPPKTESPSHLQEDYLAATRRDHMGGGARIDPDYDPLDTSSDYKEAKRHDYMPQDSTQDPVGLIDWFKEMWHETKHDLKERWDKLSEEDIADIEGDRTKLRTHLTRHYYLSEEQAEIEMDEFLRSKQATGSTGLDHHLRTSWERDKVDIQANWDRLKPEDVAEIQGDRERLKDSLRRRYDWDEQEADEEISNFYSQRDLSDRAHHRFERDIASEDQDPDKK